MLQLLHAAVLCLLLLLLLPSLVCDNLPCYYSPIQDEGETFERLLTVCPPEELCFKADGQFGNHSALLARGCMAQSDCSQVHSIGIKGINYTMTYSCCDRPYCNSCLGVKEKSLYITVTLLTATVMANIW